MEEKIPYRIEGRPPTIYRVVKSSDNPYVMIDRRPIDNPKLSFKAKGILTYLMSRPDGWEVSVADLIKRSTDGEASVRAGLKELKEAGHMRYTQSRKSGRITGWLIEIFEIPLPPHRDFLNVEIQDVENRGQVLKTLSIKDLSNGAKAPLPLEWQIKGEQPIQFQDLFTVQVIDAANLIDMGCKGAGGLSTAFMEARHIIIPESKIKGNRRAAKEMLEMGVKPEHITKAVRELAEGGLTITDLFSVSKTAISLANPMVKIEKPVKKFPTLVNGRLA